jgi:hypothetical protein
MPEFEHPSLFRLKVWLAGDDPDSQLSEHLKHCAKCKEQLDHLSQKQQLFLAQEDPAQFVNRIWPPSPEPSPRRLRPQEKMRMPWWGWWGIASAATAALALLFVPRLISPPLPGPQAGDEIRIKGPALQLKAIVQPRGGQQYSKASRIKVSPNMELGLELDLKSPMRVMAGFLDENNKWISLIDEQRLLPGTHFGKGMLTIKEKPSSGWLIAGSPAKIRHIIRESKNRSPQQVRGILQQHSSSITLIPVLAQAPSSTDASAP